MDPGQAMAGMMTMEWLAPARAQIAAAIASDRAPQALLIDAAPGAGGGLLALWLAQLLMCKAPADRPCGRCAGCEAVAQQRHPDLLQVGLIEESQQIKVDQVRELAAELALSSHQGGWRVALINPADALNRNAANSLLKTLEEPAARTLLVLVAEQPSRLPATILSRCLRVRVRAPARDQALAWLAGLGGGADWEAVLDVIGNAPLAAAALDPAAVAQLRAETLAGLKELAEGGGDAAGLADRWTRSELDLRLACFENWLTDRIRRRLAAPVDSSKVSAESHPRAAAKVSNPIQLFEALERLREYRAALASSMNRSLNLESLLRSLTH